MNLFGKCNSHKCNCPRCKDSRLVAHTELTNLIDARVKKSLSDERRSEVTYRRIAEKTLADIDARETFAAKARSDYREKFGTFERAEHREAADYARRTEKLREYNEKVPSRNRIYYSRDHKRYWKWQRCPHGWRKANVVTKECFGPTYSAVDFTEDGFRATGSIWAGAKSGPRFEATLEKVLTQTPEWAACPCLPMTGDKPVLTSLQLSILLWRKSHPADVPYPRQDLVSSHLRNLALQELIQFTGASSDGDRQYVLTDRARVLIDAVQKLPLPERATAPWVMPS